MSKRKAVLPILTRAESEIMARYWEQGPMTVSALHALLPGKAYTSLATLVKILEQKGYLQHEEEGRAFVFRAAVPPETARRQHLRDLVDRLFGGRPQDLAVGLLDDEELSRADLEALRKEIDQRLGKGKKR